MKMDVTQPTGLYLFLYHGRDDPDMEMEGWGYEGPVIGPLENVTITYLDNVELRCTDAVARKFFPDEVGGLIFLKHEEGCIEYNGSYYGDFTVYHHTQGES